MRECLETVCELCCAEYHRGDLAVGRGPLNCVLFSHDGIEELVLPAVASEAKCSLVIDHLSNAPKFYTLLICKLKVFKLIHLLKVGLNYY